MPIERVSAIPPFLYAEEASYVSQGNNVEVYGDKERVIKIVKAGLTLQEAMLAVVSLQKEDELLRKYLDKYAVSTSFVVGSSEDHNAVAVAIVQPRINGISLNSALKKIYSGDYDPVYMLDFFSRSLTMYREIGRMPDFFADMYRTFLNMRLIEPIHMRFYPNDRTNVIVSDHAGELFPNLVDTAIARKLGHIEGKLYDFPLAAKTRIAVARLKRL